MSQNVNWAGDSHTWISNPSFVGKEGSQVRQRTLVLCFDGTGDSFDNDNSNVVQLTALLKKDDPTKQMVYYQTGIGTSSDADARFRFVRNVTKSLDSMFAITLGTHVLGGYEFLVDHYHEGDSICIFGFSRGAYTARALAGMIQKVGLLPTGNRQQLPFAYQIFANQDLKADHVEDFKKTFAIDVKIQFVGVWDTVESVGIFPRHLPFVSSNTAIRCFRHAVALDEHRAKFLPNFMHFPEDKDKKPDTTKGSTDPLTFETLATWNGQSSQPPAKLTRNPSTVSDATVVENTSPQDQFPKKPVANPNETDAQEVWFAGVHTDVGGGSVQNKTRHSLARISLRWMIRECWKTNTGIIFDADKLQKDVGMDIDKINGVICDAPPRLDALEKARFLEGRIRSAKPNPLQMAWQAFTSPAVTLNDILNHFFIGDPPSIYGKNPTDMPFLGEAVEELLDALSPMHDQLQSMPVWWALELMPFWTTKEKALHEKKEDHVPFPGLFCAPWNLKEHLTNWMKFGDHHLRTHHFIVNCGSGRKVYKHIMERGMPVHPSVLTRLEAVDQNYRKGTYVPLIRPNIPGYTDKKAGIDIRPMTRDEWMLNQVGASGAHPWFYWWSSDSDLMKIDEEKVKKGHKEAKANSKKLKTESYIRAFPLT